MSSAKNLFPIWNIFNILLCFQIFYRILRVPDEQLGYILFNLSMGQILCLVFFIFGSYLTLKI